MAGVQVPERDAVTAVHVIHESMDAHVVALVAEVRATEDGAAPPKEDARECSCKFLCSHKFHYTLVYFSIRRYGAQCRHSPAHPRSVERSRKILG